jgi:hypothetical protein
MTIDEEMAKWYRDKQQQIDDLLAQIDSHKKEGCDYFNERCAYCRALRSTLEKARYYGD